MTILSIILAVIAIIMCTMLYALVMKIDRKHTARLQSDCSLLKEQVEALAKETHDKFRNMRGIIAKINNSSKSKNNANKGN